MCSYRSMEFLRDVQLDLNKSGGREKIDSERLLKIRRFFSTKQFDRSHASNMCKPTYAT